MQLLAHLLFPRHTNNYRAKLLHPLWLVIFALFFFLVVQVHLPTKLANVLGYTASRLPVEEIVALTNQKRQAVGLSPLKFNQKLAQAAAQKGQDMLTYNYWAHVSPRGTTPWDFFNYVGYVYRYAGENLARDFETPGTVIDAWLASPSHRENLLSPKYDDIGVAVVQGDLNGEPTTLVVQLFGKQVGSGGASELAPTAALGPSPAPQAVVPTTSFSMGVQSSASPFVFKQTIALSLIGLFLLLLAIDGFIVMHRQIVRISGRTFAHVGFLASIGLIILLLQRGLIL